MEVSKVLSAFADLAPTSGERVFDVSGAGRPLIWLRQPDGHPEALARIGWRRWTRCTVTSASCAWAWPSWWAALRWAGAQRKVRLPLPAQPVRLERGLRGYRVVPAGDLAVTGTPGTRDRGNGRTSGSIMDAAGPRR